jgi:hypothetical protein
VSGQVPIQVNRSKMYRESHPEKVAGQKRAYYETHREEVVARQRAFRESRRLRPRRVRRVLSCCDQRFATIAALKEHKWEAHSY